MTDDLAMLLLDPRFSAVHELINSVREELIMHMSDPAASEHHGLLAHDAGGIDALDQLRKRMEQVIEEFRSKDT
jgi:hypothetical protein|tara:strand:+ start:13424 stop:13645 length:222 start_codon:yes stop_codon:yes gene_type:complete